MSRSGNGRYDAIVVGGGHNGLTAAAYLARAGLQALRARAARAARRLLRHRGDRPRLPRLHHVLHREHAAPRGDPRPGAQRPRPAHGALRSAGCRCRSPTATSSRGGPTRSELDAELRRHSSRDADTFRARGRRSSSGWRATCSRSSSSRPPTCTPLASQASCEAVPRRPAFPQASPATRSARWSHFSPAASATSSTATTSRRRSRRCSSPTTSTASTAAPTSRARRSACCSTCSPAATTRSRASTGHVIGGMGAITQAMAAACRQLGRRDPHRRAGGAHRRARTARARGVVLEDGDEIEAPLVLSNADPKRTFLGLVERGRAPRRSSAPPIARHQDGRAPAPRSTSSSPRSRVVTGMPRDADALRARALHAGAVAGVRRARATTRPSAARSPRSCGSTASWPRTWIRTLAPAGPPRHDLLRPVRALPAEGAAPGTRTGSCWATAW